MPRLRGARYLSCFYCGKRSKSQHDGVLREFLCLHCDATNYLDENGEITDPPVATEREAPATSYASQQPASSPPSATDTIFCPTCIKNQRLFTSSLAQYLPDDPSSPDYPALERNYYRFRKSLEERYPQVCEDCADKVDARIRQAGYTAKTDHLRRMMEKSRGRKQDASRTTALDWANTLGRGLWWSGFVVQMLWHLRSVAAVLVRHDGMVDPDDSSWASSLTSGLASAVALLPPAETLITGAVAASILSAWWNPRFVQVSRGFSRHLLGFTQWYSFQGLTIFLRFLFRRILEIEEGHGQSRNAQLSVHAVMAAVMCLICVLSRRSIREDTTPLFGTHSTTVSPRITRSKKTSTPAKKKEDTMTFSELLNDALDSPSATPQKDPFNQPLISSLPPPYPPINPVQVQRSPLDQLNEISISPPRASEVQYSDEMDWTPTQDQQSQHRAFRESPASNPGRAFGEAPVIPEGNPFWYKVPSAPINPARRLRNPPNMPVLRSKPVETENGLFRGVSKPQGPGHTQADEAAVAFKPPQFFAPVKENDEANSLADLLGQSFSLSQEQDGPPQTPGARPRRFSSRRVRPSTWGSNTAAPARRPLAVEFTALIFMLILWVLTMAAPIPFGRELQLAVLSAAGVIALHATGETNQDFRDGQVPSVARYADSVLGVMELASICWVAWGVFWQAELDHGTYGVGIFVAMLGHQVWGAFM